LKGLGDSALFETEQMAKRETGQGDSVPTCILPNRKI
jgi:hypothetical protein